MSTLAIPAVSCARSVAVPATLGWVLPNAAARFGKRPALFFEGHWSSYHDLDRDSSRLADQLARLGVGPMSRVVLHVPNSRDWIIAYHAIAKTGAVVVPVDFMLTKEELVLIARDSGATVLISSLDDPAALEQIRRTAPFATLVLSSDAAEIEDAAWQSALIAAGNELFRPVDARPDDLACISYTSGSTGKPKGVMLSHRSILLCAALSAEAHGRTASDVFLSALPCTHVYGNTAVHASILVGGRVVLHRRFNAESVLSSIAAHRVTMFEGVPTMYLRMLSHPRCEAHDLRSLTRCTVGGQSMPVTKFAEVEQMLGCPLIELWGMTELAGAAITHRIEDLGPHGSIGRPLPGMEACIRSDGGCVRNGTGSIGELYIRGLLVMLGYLNEPEATADVIDGDGWLRTGDTATIDERGYVFIAGRTKDIVISGGYNIHPTEVENAIAQHPSVASVAVGKSHHEELGEIAVAYVVLKPGHHALAGEIEQSVCNRLARYKVPRRIVFVEDLPKNGSGKVLRHRLKEADL
jgi:long-chain acyl-CoA synthetase